MKKTIDNVFFWLGEDGELEGLSEEEFKQKQKEWSGVRPKDCG